jgi:hypothetical protein
MNQLLPHEVIINIQKFIHINKIHVEQIDWLIKEMVWPTCCYSSCFKKLIKLITDSGVSINITNDNNSNFIQIVANKFMLKQKRSSRRSSENRYQSFADFINILINGKININNVNNDNESVLMSILKLLTEHNNNKHYIDDKDVLIIDNIVLKLLESRASIDITYDSDGNNILIYSVKYNLFNTLYYLLKNKDIYNIDINYQNKDLDTALHFVSNGILVQLLLDNNANMNILNIDDKTPFDNIRYNPALVDLMLKRGYILSHDKYENCDSNYVKVIVLQKIITELKNKIKELSG